MALSDQDKTQIRYLLGYSVLENNSDIVRAINSMDAQSTAEPVIRGILAELAAIDASISNVKNLAVAIADGSVQLRAAYSLGVLRSMGREQVRRLALFLGVDVRNSIYSGSGETEYKGGFFAPEQRRYGTG